VRCTAQPTAIWRIRDAEGEVQALHVRFDRDGAKECRWLLPGADAWGLDGRKVSTLPLYGSERVKEWSRDAIVVVVEGEKAADALLEAGFCALGTVTGAGDAPSTEVLRVLEGFEVVLWPDNDDQGRAHMGRVAKPMQSIAAGVSVFTWHDAPEKADAADHPTVLHGNEKERDILLNDLMSAPRWVSQVSPSLTDLIIDI
jgi:DNA primase